MRKGRQDQTRDGPFSARSKDKTDPACQTAIATVLSPVDQTRIHTRAHCTGREAGWDGQEDGFVACAALLCSPHHSPAPGDKEDVSRSLSLPSFLSSPSLSSPCSFLVHSSPIPSLTPHSQMAPVISKIYIYPIKSCKALEISESQLSKCNEQLRINIFFLALFSKQNCHPDYLEYFISTNRPYHALPTAPGFDTLQMALL